MEKNLFQKLPKVDILMKNEKLEEISKKLSYHNYYQAVKDGIEFFRNKIKNNEIENFSEDEIILKIKEISGINTVLINTFSWSFLITRLMISFMYRFIKAVEP